MFYTLIGEGNGNPLQYSCLSMDRGSLVGYSPQGRRELDMTEQVMKACVLIIVVVT